MTGIETDLRRHGWAEAAPADAPSTFASWSVAWDRSVAALPGVGLEEIGEVSLLGRFDQKYLLPLDRLPQLIEAVGRGSVAVAALEVDGCRAVGYSSVYFDSRDLSSYRDHRQGRRRRYKVRTRHYGDPTAAVLEVKLKGDRGRTIKHRRPHSAAQPDRLDAGGRDFVEATVSAAYDRVVPEVLRATVVTTYRRTTLVDRTAGTRLTIDRGLVVQLGEQRADLGRAYAIVESKSAERRPDAHRQLLRVGARPQQLSKYCLGIGMLARDVASNRWEPALRRLAGPQAALGDGAPTSPGRLEN